MRMTLVAAALLLCATPAFAQSGRDPLPHDEQSLRELNSEQLRMVRRASRMCSQNVVGTAIKAERNPCVIAATDNAIADSDDPALQAFHAALPDNERYDEYRTDTTWRAFLVDEPAHDD